MSSQAKPAEKPKGALCGPFADAAQDLRRAGLAVIPCGGDDGKKPSMRWPKRPLGEAAINKLITPERFGNANIGILTGGLSKVFIVDIDDPKIVAAMLNRFGSTPMITQTPSGGVHLWYKWDGERCGNLRREGLAVDLKGQGGFIVVPPSFRPSTGQPYTWLKGCPNDLSKLRVVRPGSVNDANEPEAPVPLRAIKEGRRNGTLFKLLLREVRHCDSEAALQDVAETINDDCDPPLPDSEVHRTVASVWNLEATGNNWAGKEARIVFTASEFDDLMEKPDALALRGLLRMMHGGRHEPFAISAKIMAEIGIVPGWGPKRYYSATNWLVDRGYLARTYKGGKGPGDKSLFTLSTPPGLRVPQRRQI
jgi:hypothetical protein